MNGGHARAAKCKFIRCKADEMRADPTLAEAGLRRILAEFNGWTMQHTFFGVYVLDAYHKRLRIAIEVDGAYHDAHDQTIKDQCRTEFITSKNVSVLRFTNEAVLNSPELVSEEIAHAMDMSKGTAKPREDVMYELAKNGLL